MRSKKSKKYDGEHCPNCGSDSIEAPDVMEATGTTTASRGVHCLACDATWTENFETVGFDNLEVPARE